MLKAKNKAVIVLKIISQNNVLRGRIIKWVIVSLANYFKRHLEYF